MIAALFVESNGCYAGLPDVDPWPLARDARTYAGPWPAVAHPPCERYGKLWHTGPKGHQGLADDDGCFASALASVRHWGGVLYHPAHSHAWRLFGLMRPPFSGGWVRADALGWTCQVDQGFYGHRGQKSTWLYVVGGSLPSLRWGKSKNAIPVEDMSHRERRATPVPFRDLLLSIARSARPAASMLGGVR